MGVIRTGPSLMDNSTEYFGTYPVRDDQHANQRASLSLYFTTASRKSWLVVSHQIMLRTRKRCSSFMLLNNFHRGDWFVDPNLPGSSCCPRDRSNTQKPRDAATAIDRPKTFPTAATWQGPFDATYVSGTRDSAHSRETSVELVCCHVLENNA